LFSELRSAIAAEAKRIRQTALALAEVDVLGCLAHIAAMRNYCRPQLEVVDESSDGNPHAGIWRLSKPSSRDELQEMSAAGDRFVPTICS